MTLYNSNSKKISEFQTQSLVQDSDLFTFVRGNTNYKLSWSSLKLDLGVTGSISPIGSPTSIPVLQSFNNDYSIRGIETIKGMSATLSAENGVMLSNNFTQVGAGQKIIKDLNAPQYEFKTILSGTNINVTDTGDSLRIDLVAEASASKTVVIAQESDFPDPVLGVITLEPDTDYLLVSDITTSNRFVGSRPNTMRASSSQMVTLTYTGTGDMFTITNPSFKIVNITVSCPNGNLFNSTAPDLPGIVQMVESNVKECETLGMIDGNFITRFTNVAFENIKTGGLTFNGANEILVVDVGVAFLGGGSLIDLGSSTFNSISIESGTIPVSAPGSFFLSGLANSGNLNPGGLGTVINNKGFGSGQPLNGITTDDARWNFFANNNIADTRPDALMYLSAVATTAIVTTSVPVLMNGTWTESRTSQMTTTAAGRATYDGEKNSTLPITAKVSAEPVSGNGVQIGVYLAKNGVVINETEAYGTADAGKPTSITVIWQDSFSNGDYYEVFIENNTNTTDITVSTAQMRIN